MPAWSRQSRVSSRFSTGYSLILRYSQPMKNVDLNLGTTAGEVTAMLAGLVDEAQLAERRTLHRQGWVVDYRPAEWGISAQQRLGLGRRAREALGGGISSGAKQPAASARKAAG
jgi:hypothetical protein